MIDNRFRQLLPRFVSPLLGLYRWLGWTPNHVTLAGFVIALAASAAVAVEANLWALGLWWLSRLADGTDGIYARESGQESAFGGYLDIVLDMAAYGAMVLGFAVARPELAAHWIVIIFLYVLCITSALALGMQEANLELEPRDDRSLRLGAGLAEGGETGLAYSVFLIWPSLMVYSATAWIVILLTTIIARSLLAKRILTVVPATVATSQSNGSRPPRSDDSLT